MTEFVRFRIHNDSVSIFGERREDGFITERFATSIYGVSDRMEAKVWPGPRSGIEVVSQEFYNACFLNCSVEEMDEEDKTATLDELRRKYPNEDEGNTLYYYIIEHPIKGVLQENSDPGSPRFSAVKPRSHEDNKRMFSLEEARAVMNSYMPEKIRVQCFVMRSPDRATGETVWTREASIGFRYRSEA